jgi:NTE family protein
MRSLIIHPFIVEEGIGYKATGATRRVDLMANGALVLAGGGVAGIAWETGVLLGIQDAEPAAAASILSAPTALVGTSAGAAVAAQIAGGTSLQELYDAQLDDETGELFVQIDLASFGAMMAGATAQATSPEDARRRLGAIALAADTPSVATRRAVIRARLAIQNWGERSLRLTAVDAETGDLRIFDRDSGIDLVDAVMASCAVPGIWPTVEFDGHRYMDGGMRSGSNADIAAGSDPVLIITPSTEETPMGRAVPQTELDALVPARVHVVYADAASIGAFGTNPLDPASRKPAAIAGREVGHRVAAEVAAFWR